MVHGPVVVLLIIAVGLTAPVVAAVFAFRRPSLIYLLVLFGAGFLYLSPPWIEVVTYTSPDPSKPGFPQTIVTERWIGHGWTEPPRADHDSEFRTTHYRVFWPQFVGEVALLVAAVTGLYFLLRYVLRRERAAVGPP